MIVARFLTIWTGIPFPIDLVTSDSMNPSLMEGDIVAWTPTKIEEIEVGDVVVFKSYLNWPDEKIVVHRVSDIKTNRRGEKLLETKGDANKWTDQAGPHIPEPYIREDHLMGKTLSINQHPLKIPFVGQLGVWINEGLTMISRPSSSKETAAYAGIFTPLIISTVILVALMFIVPEKTKTIKEKIKYHIFGPKTVSLKKIFVLFLVIYIAFFTIIHCFAYDTTTASLGIEKGSEKTDINFGRINKGTESFPKNLDLINPSVSKVKGIVFGDGEINQYVSKKTFEIEAGEAGSIPLKATALNNSKNGTYTGDIMVYSSPFWTMFPDDLLNSINEWNSEFAVFTIDFLVALVLTILTSILLGMITLTGYVYKIWSTNSSWWRSPRIIIKTEKIKKIGKKLKRTVVSKMGWIGNLDIADDKIQKTTRKSLIKPVIASLVILPLMFLISDQIEVTIISAVIAGIIAYTISCKLRTKIVITIIFTLTIGISHMLIDSNMIIISLKYNALEFLTLALGTMGIYLLILGILIIPLSLAACYIVCFIRNVKERKKPLLILEGKCDL